MSSSFLDKILLHSNRSYIRVYGVIIHKKKNAMLNEIKK
jgi:hypothetical protein